jgi:hypothetical protein
MYGICVAPLGLVFLNLRQPVFTPLCCMLSVEPVNTNFIVFSLIRTHDLPHSIALSNNLSLSETDKLCEYYVSLLLSQGVKSVISYVWYLLFSSDFFLTFYMSWVFTPLCCMLSVEPVNTNFIVFSLIRTHDLPHSILNSENLNTSIVIIELKHCSSGNE